MHLPDNPSSSSSRSVVKRTSRHRVFLFLTVALLSAAIPAYFFAQSYQLREIRRFDSVAAQSLSSLKKHDEALQKIYVTEREIHAFAEKFGLEESTAAALLQQMKSDFSRGEYTMLDSLHSSVSAEISFASAEEDAATTSAALREKLAALEKKRDEYKKQGVTVATVSARIASASADIASRNFSVVPDVISFLDHALDTMLASKKEADKLAAAKALAAVPAPVAAQSNGGVTYERKVVNTAIGAFTADILTVDMNRVKVKTFTGNDSDCVSNCVVKPLAAYVSENGGIAGINGTYFCPPDYAQCAGVTNSFNTLVLDYKSKHYLNSAQNQYSVNPLISFYPDGAHFYTQALGFGRDTSAYGVISNHPTLVHNGGVATQVNLDAKSSGKGLRGGIGFRDKTLWAVVTRNATVPESGYVFTALGAVYAMNLDGGGSAAMYFGGYKVGPGRQLPNAIVFTN
jgi:exopolysaccharide biosynthesis protein